VDYDSQLAGHASTLGIAFTFWGVRPVEVYADSSLMEVGEGSIYVMVTSLLNEETEFFARKPVSQSSECDGVTLVERVALTHISPRHDDVHVMSC